QEELWGASERLSEECMKVVRVVVAVLVMLASAAVGPDAAFAQQTESRILGTLVDESGGALPGVTVTVTSTDTGAVRTVVSDTDGTYVVTNLGRGSYTVLAELAGFAPQNRTVTLGVGQVETVDLR